jgi:O-antigen ligase
VSSRLRSRAEELAVACVFALMSGGPLFRVRTWWPYDDPLAGDQVIVATQSVVVLTAVITLAASGRWRRLHRLPALLALVLVGWLLITALWSLDPGRTVREALLVGGALAVGAAAHALLGTERLLACTWAGLHIGLVWSAIAIQQLRPGTQDAFGNWTGVYFNRNSLALIATLGLVASTALLVRLAGAAVRDPRSRLLSIGAAGLVGAVAILDLRLLAGAGSLTPVAAAVVGALAGGAFRWVGDRISAGRARAAFLWTVAGGAVALVAVAFVLRGPISSSFARGNDYSGRIGLWSAAGDWFLRRPVAGFGYLAVWSDAAFIEDVWEAGGLAFDSAHNALVEVAVGAGALGVLAFLAFVASMYWTLGELALGSGPARVVWPFAVFVAWLVENSLETLLVGAHLSVVVLGVLVVSPAGLTATGTGRLRPCGS